MNNIKTIDINALEWRDKVNGNSYFAGTVTVNYGMEDEREYTIPYQYGYGSHYIDVAKKELENKKEITAEYYPNGASESLWQICQKNGIILRTNKKDNCLKRELKNI